MTIDPLGQQIRIPDAARGSFNIRVGETVTINVLKELAPQYWAIGIGGRVFRAHAAQLALTAGMSFQAEVTKRGTSLEIKILAEKPPEFQAFLQRAGFAQDRLTYFIVLNLVKNHLKLDAATVKVLRSNLEKLPGDPKRKARLLCLLEAKGMRPGAVELEELIALLGYGEREERRYPRQRQPRDHKSLPQAEALAARLKESMRRAAGREPGLLAFFNHLPSISGDSDWLIAPYALDEDAGRLKGTLRFLYDRYLRKIKKIVIAAHTPEGKSFQFDLAPEKGRYKMKVYTNQTALGGAPLSRFREEVIKLRQLGVDCDDTIIDDAGEEFEIASSREAYQSVDTEG